MKKIILAFDGANFSEGAFNFALRINEMSPILLTGVFLPQIDYSALWGYSAAAVAGTVIPLVEEEEAETVVQNIERFKSLCQLNNIEYRVHKDFTDFALPGLKLETRFSDLLVLGSESFYEYLGVNEPNAYLKDAIHNAECPVLVVPEQFDFPENNILAYDGSESSVYAIKQFAYLFPEFTGNKTVLLYAGVDDNEGTFPEEHNIEELCSRHFTDLTLFKLGVDPKKYFAVWSSERKGSIVVCGSFGRSSVSMLFKKSFVSAVIRDHKLPVFIASR
jgi:nucleotide-binding universal stress UspA family protein